MNSSCKALIEIHLREPLKYLRHDFSAPPFLVTVDSVEISQLALKARPLCSDFRLKC